MVLWAGGMGWPLYEGIMTLGALLITLPWLMALEDEKWLYLVLVGYMMIILNSVVGDKGKEEWHSCLERGSQAKCASLSQRGVL